MLGPNVLAQGRRRLAGEASLWSGELGMALTEKSRRWRHGESLLGIERFLGRVDWQ